MADIICFYHYSQLYKTIFAFKNIFICLKIKGHGYYFLGSRRRTVGVGWERVECLIATELLTATTDATTSFDATLGQSRSDIATDSY
jgi:hypothetical protein